MILDQPYSRKRTHQDLAYTAGELVRPSVCHSEYSHKCMMYVGYQMDEVGHVYPASEGPIALHIVASEKQAMEEQDLPWLQWTNRSTIVPLKPVVSQDQRLDKISTVNLCSDAIVSPSLTVIRKTVLHSDQTDPPLTLEINEENKEDEADCSINDCDSGLGSGGSQWNGVRLTLDDLVLTSPSAAKAKAKAIAKPPLSTLLIHPRDPLRIQTDGVAGDMTAACLSITERFSIGSPFIVSDGYGGLIHSSDSSRQCSTAESPVSTDHEPPAVPPNSLETKDQCGRNRRKSICSDNSSEWGNFVDLDVSSNKPFSPSPYIVSTTESSMKTSPILDAKAEEIMYSSNFGCKCCSLFF
jgi:hypothetical protein